MSTLTITIDIDELSNTEVSVETEVVYLLRKLVTRIEDRDHIDSSSLYNFNGNKVGQVIVK